MTSAGHQREPLGGEGMDQRQPDRGGHRLRPRARARHARHARASPGRRSATGSSWHERGRARPGRSQNAGHARVFGKAATKCRARARSDCTPARWRGVNGGAGWNYSPLAAPPSFACRLMTASATAASTGKGASIFRRLNEAQLRAVEHGIGTGDGPAAGHRRGRLRQDDDAGGARRAPRARRRRSVAHPSAHVFAARRRGDGTAGRARPARGPGPAAPARRAAAGLVRHLSQHRRAAAAAACETGRPRSVVHGR